MISSKQHLPPIIKSNFLTNLIFDNKTEEITVDKIFSFAYSDYVKFLNKKQMQGTERVYCHASLMLQLQRGSAVG